MATATKPKGAALAPFPGGFPGLFEAYGQALADHVAHAFPPQYRLKPPTAFLDRIRRLGRAPFPAQIQAAAALATRLENQHAAMLVGEASVGKTQIALTTAAMLGVRSVLIVAASNLLSQWQDEIRAVLPKARVYTDLTSISAVERTLGQINASQDLSIVLLARDQAKLGGPWRPSALEIAGPAPASPTATTVKVPYCLGCRKVLLRVLTATYLGKDGQDRRATKLLSVPVHRLAPGALAYCPDCRRVAMDVHVTEPAPATWLACSRCRAALATVHVERKPDPNTRRVVETPKTVDMWTASYLEAGRRRCPACGDACWQSTRTLHGRAMFPIAKYIARHYPDTFDLLVMDEVQDAKAGDSAQGMMLTDLVRASRRVLGQTATVSGGKPSTMFYLLHRLLPSFRRAWPYTAATRFSREHGLAEVLSEQQTRKSTDKSGKITSRTTVKRTMRELPGISPTILRYVLDSAVFLTLRDLGVEMPPYTEEAVEIEMLPEQAREYEALVGQLAPHLKAGLRLRRLKALGTALQALLTYPDQPWRGEAVTHHKTGELVASAPALDPNVQYPKEAELLRMCRREATDGRRVLVYVTHTDRRDIIPRIETVLREGGLRAEVLRAETVSPRKRAQWVRSQAQAVDVLVTHPKLVGTGLNIPEFHTIIWYEPEWSAYTLRQASRRTWRIGQDKPVRVYFLVYAKTAQQAALALVSRKILASLLVEGQVETDHAIATYDAGGEIFYELAKAVLDRTQISDVHETLRTLSQAQTRAQELCDTTLAPKPVPVAAPTPTPKAPRRRTIAVTAPVRGEQTLLFEFAS
jgi:superfamily II DNA or RNA helicase